MCCSLWRVAANDRLTAWRRWLQCPQTLGWRRAVFHVHLWSGLGLGLYVFFISVTGSLLVYRNELYFAAIPRPVVSTGPGLLLSDDELANAARDANPGYRVSRIIRPISPEQAVDVWLIRGDETRKRYFDPRTGADVGSSALTAFRLVSKLIELHDNLLAGAVGRCINGLGALAVILMALTGMVIWWPGATRWRRSLTLRRSAGWQRLTWDLHSAIGFWSSGFVLVIALSGVYLCFPEALQAFADRLVPPTDDSSGTRLVDRTFYWLAYLHFGRINGIGIPCGGPGLCDQATKAVWAIGGLAPASMFVTGTLVWWNRVVRPWHRRRRP